MLQYIDSFPVPLGPVKQRKLGEVPTIHQTARIRDSQIGSWTDIGLNRSIMESIFDDYSYAAGDVSIIYSTVGKFCSLASHVRINWGTILCIGLLSITPLIAGFNMVLMIRTTRSSSTGDELITA